MVSFLGSHCSTLTTKSSLQPGVSDPEMEQLVTEKVDIFWKGIESGANKRGQVSLLCLSCIFPIHLVLHSDNSNIFGEKGKEVLVSGVHRGGGSAMGTMVCSLVVFVGQRG